MKNKKIINSLGIVTIFAPVFVLANWNLTNNYGLPDASIYLILNNLLQWLLGIFAILGILGFAISGIMYLVSAGDDDMISKAKKGMTYSIIGIVVGLSGYIVISAIDTWLSGNSGAYF